MVVLKVYMVGMAATLALLLWAHWMNPQLSAAICARQRSSRLILGTLILTLIWPLIMTMFVLAWWRRSTRSP